MSYDIPSISDLEAIQLLNKHYAEVITSKEGGVSSAADITQTTNPITGVTRRTLYKILDDMDDTFLERLLKMAFTPVGTFTTGATLTDARQTLLWEVSEGGDGHYYSWSGTFPKVVAAGSSPSPIASGAWVDRTDDTLRTALLAHENDYSAHPQLSSFITSEANRAQAAAEAASATGKIYETSAAGQADTGLVSGDYFWVVSTSSNNILELWRKGISFATDTGKRSVNSEFVIDIIGKGEVDEIIHAFTDKNGKMVAFINKDGELQTKLTEEMKDDISVIKGNDDDDFALIITDSESRIIFSLSKDGFADLGLTNKNADGENLYVFLDATGKVVAYIDNQGKLVSQSSGTDPSTTPPTDSDLGRADVYPQKVPISSIDQDVTATVELRQSSLPIQLTAKGRSGDPDILINGNGLTHPKVIYIPGGWNGYEYWMAVTPYFGVVGAQSAYENPHVLASNDLINWVEPSGGRIDVPEDGNGSYWSDTHLAVADDGYMYCFYRGTGFSFSGKSYAYKRSRDGVSWSDRVITTNVEDPKFNVIRTNDLLSPSIFMDGQKWACYNLIWSQANGITIPPSNTSTAVHVLRRTDNDASGDFGPFSVDQVVNYSTREWGADSDPWHLDAIKVGNLYIHLIAAGLIGSFYSNRLYLAYSTDGWNFKVLPKLSLGVDNFYRSSIHLESIEGNKVNLTLVAARTSGTIDLYKLTLEVN